MQIIYEDNHLLVINKACSEIVQGDKTGDKSLIDTLKDYIKEKYAKPGDVFLGLVHRLDRPTSGLVIYARTSKALSRMTKQFRDKSIKKLYWAVVDQKPPENEGKLLHYLLKNETQNKSYAFDYPKSGTKEAALTYRLLGKSDNYYLLEIDIHTGRHHQIRAQLATIGCKIKGDMKYGFPRSNPDGGIHLHARYLEFKHPVREDTISLTAPVPDDGLWQYFEKECNNNSDTLK
jgi:23S rRNA pseudouridine1911/1915/1917 synthase